MGTPWRPPPWFAKPAARILFLRQIGQLDDVALTTVKEYRRGFSVTFTLEPAGVPRRTVIVSFRSHIPHVHVDGPSESPHRYSDGTLCMWYPGDPRDLRWMPSDGAHKLVAYIAAHLVREEWWRMNGEWLGPEVRHGSKDLRNDPKPVRVGE